MYATKTNGNRMGAFVVLMALGIASAAYAQPAAIVTAVLDGQTVVIADGDTVDLGEVPVAESTNFLFQVQNQGDGALSISSLSASSNAGNVQLEQAGFTQVLELFACSVQFSAQSHGSVEFDVSINSNDPAAPYAFTVQAIATAPKLLLTDALSEVAEDSPLELDPVEVEQSAGAALTARNIGNELLNFIGDAEVTDLTGGDAADVTITLPNTIQPNGFGVITVAFEPTTIGLREFLVELNTNDPDTPYAFTILAEGLEPEVEIVDCNFNGIDDSEDLANGTHLDCDFDGLPDDCETDSDGDGVADDCDECPGEDDLLDTDTDSVPDCLDNCPLDANADQTDTNGDGVGDACEETEEIMEDCNLNQIDDATDIEDGTEDDCNFNGVPDSCEQDSDNDGVIDGCDVCPGENDERDEDNDGVADCLDNCPNVANFNQSDNDGNGIGDACEEEVDPFDPFDPFDPKDKDDEGDLGDLGTAFCGAGTMAMIPMMCCGLCGMRASGRRRTVVDEA